jgi:hypothetical protein
MTKWLKIPLGVVCLLAGGALFFSSCAALADSLIATRTGVPLGSLFGFIAGLCGLGAAADCLGPPQRPAAKKEGVVAKSIWATRAHVDEFGIGEN